MRHHIVTYLYVKLKEPYSSKSLFVSPDPEEVGAAAWLDRNFVQGLVKTHDNPNDVPDLKSLNIAEKIK